MVKCLAPAKVNLCLHVNGRRADGYHELCMLMQKVALFDELDVQVTQKHGVTFSCENADLGAAQNNLVVRAAQAMLLHDHLQRGLEIVLHKNIPVAAGLGGGSSDAATTLTVVNNLLQLGLSKQVLAEEALKLGADVPFFLYGSSAWASGIGEQLRPAALLPQFWLLLVNPGVGVSTARVYNAMRPENYSTCSIEAQIDTDEKLVALLHNDLESATIMMCPEVVRIKDELLRLGAHGALMSGSGPTVFGLFFDEKKAQGARKKLQLDSNGWSAVVATI